MKQLLTTNALPAQMDAVIPPTVLATANLPALPSVSGASVPDALEDIRVRAETVSNLLKEIMDHGVTRHWGIND
jgi:hypothetical protein